jgi:hypothetical protein
MSSPSEDTPDFAVNFSDPYFFKPLYTNYRRVLQYLASRQDDLVAGMELSEILSDHDSIRQLVAWNFLSHAQESDISEYETGISLGDWQSMYKVTKQARDYLALELNNFVDLQRAIMIWLRADMAPEVRVGMSRISIRTISFYQLVMLLNKSETIILSALRALESNGFARLKLVWTEDGRVWSHGSEIDITEQGIRYLEKGVVMTVNNVSITGSTVGVFAMQSTLTNVETAIGNLNSQGQSEIAQRLADVKNEVGQSKLLDQDKKELLEQIEVIAAEAGKSTSERKPSIVKSAISYVGTLATGAEGVKKLWETCGPFLRQYFGF